MAEDAKPMHGESVNPFEFETELAKYRPLELKAAADNLAVAVKTIPAEEADRILREVADAWKDRKNPNEILEMVFSSVGRIVGLLT